MMTTRRSFISALLAGLAYWPYPNQQKNMVLACAWALTSFSIAPASQKAIDAMHLDEYCGKLDDGALSAARHYAADWVRKIGLRGKLP